MLAGLGLDARAAATLASAAIRIQQQPPPSLTAGQTMPNPLSAPLSTLALLSPNDASAFVSSAVGLGGPSSSLAAAANTGIESTFPSMFSMAGWTGLSHAAAASSQQLLQLASTTSAAASGVAFTAHPRVVYAYLKQLWGAGHREAAVAQLSVLVRALEEVIAASARAAAEATNGGLTGTSQGLHRYVFPLCNAML